MPKDNDQDKLQAHAEDFIATHQASYSEAIQQCYNVRDTTTTEAWTERYAENVKRHKSMIVILADEVIRSARDIKIAGVNEDAEKEMSKAIKDIKDERIRHEAWIARAVEPYRASVDKAKTIIQTCLQAAREYEDKQPLMLRGLFDKVRDIVDQWPTAKWDSDRGVVDIDEPKQQTDRASA